MTTSDHSAWAEGPAPEHYNLAQGCERFFMAAVGHCINWEDHKGFSYAPLTSSLWSPGNRNSKSNASCYPSTGPLRALSCSNSHRSFAMHSKDDAPQSRKAVPVFYNSCVVSRWSTSFQLLNRQESQTQVRYS